MPKVLDAVLLKNGKEVAILDEYTDEHDKKFYHVEYKDNSLEVIPASDVVRVTYVA